MSNARNLAKLSVDSNGDVAVGSLPIAVNVNTSAPADSLAISSAGNVGIGTSSPTAKLHISGSSAVATQILDGNGGSNGGTLYFYADISGGGNKFRSSIGGINISNGGSGLVFGTTTNGNTEPTERMRIDSAGRVTMPYQPVFLAKTGTDTANTGSGQPFQFSSVETNVGSYYNNSNWTFTAPVSGSYYFSAHCIFKDYPVNNSIEVAFRRNNGQSYYFDRQSKTYNVSNRFSLGGSMVINLAAGDSIYVIVFPDTTSSWSYESSSNFSGFLIG